MITPLDRRQFIRSVCVAAAIDAPAVKRVGAETKPRAAFILGLGTYTFRNQDIDGLIERCKALDLRTIELSHPQFMLPQADLNTFRATRQKAEEWRSGLAFLVLRRSQQDLRDRAFG